MTAMHYWQWFYLNNSLHTYLSTALHMHWQFIQWSEQDLITHLYPERLTVVVRSMYHVHYCDQGFPYVSTVSSRSRGPVLVKGFIPFLVWVGLVLHSVWVWGHALPNVLIFAMSEMASEVFPGLTPHLYSCRYLQPFPFGYVYRVLACMKCIHWCM